MVGNATKRDESDTPRRLVEAAIAVLERDGDAGVRVRDVAAEAGVTYSAVQFHFGGKEGLVEAAYLELFRRDLRDVLPIFAAHIATANDADEFAELLRSVSPAYFNPERAEMRRRRAQALGASATRPELAAAIAEMHRTFFDQFATVLAPAQSRGWIRADLDLRAAAAIFIGVVNARFMVEAGDTDVDLDAWDHAAVTALLGLTTSTRH